MSYLYTEHYRAHAEPSTHVTAVNARGKWIPGVIDPASRGSSQRDGIRLVVEYVELGLNLHLAEKAAAAGIQMVWQRLAGGKLKVFASCRNWQAEYKLYRRNKDGAVVKENDHLMDATRFVVISGLPLATTKPVDILVDGTGHVAGLTGSGY